jgi:5-(carboxyamino)imidazole ribonucleotide synthase
MLLQAAINYPVETFVLEKDPDCPSAHLCHHFVLGDIQDFDTVYAFGKQLDVMTIEIESVNVEALEKLEAEGVKVIPSPAALRIIQNKISQKEFYTKHEIPTAPFVVTAEKAELEKHTDFLPAVHKLAQGGYDGKGVQIIRNETQLSLGFEGAAVLEKMIPIELEISVIVAVDTKGEIVTYPPAAMVFDPQLNLLDYQIAPAPIATIPAQQADTIAQQVAKALNSPGLFAVELLADTAGGIWVNETAPRVHNSGHHSIEGNASSQFDMLWRILLEYPLGSTEPLCTTVLVNLLGSEGAAGAVRYEGLEEVLATPNTHLHLYGKQMTKPGRKMGHITYCGNDVQQLIERAEQNKKRVKVVAGE